jgi:hypothetical protein
LIVGSGHAPNPLRSHYFPPLAYHASVSDVCGRKMRL